MSGKIFLRETTAIKTVIYKKFINYFICCYIAAVLAGCTTIDVNMTSGKKCGGYTTAVQITDKKPETGYEEIGELSIRFDKLVKKDEAVKKLTEKASLCGANLVYLTPIKRIYNEIKIDTGTEETRLIRPFIFELKALMYQFRK